MVENTYKESTQVWHTGFTSLRFSHFQKRKLVSLVIFLLREYFLSLYIQPFDHQYIYLYIGSLTYPYFSSFTYTSIYTPYPQVPRVPTQLVCYLKPSSS